MNALMLRLKHENWPRHERLVQRLDLLGPGFSEASYRRLLLGLWGYYRPLESLLASLPGLYACVPDLDRRLKTPLLETDLRHLGHSRDLMARISVCEDLPLIPCLLSAGAALGPGESRMVEAARATFESLECWLFRAGSRD